MVDRAVEPPTSDGRRRAAPARDAAALVAALWQSAPPAGWPVPARARVADVWALLGRLAARADRLAARGAEPGGAASLLAQTARALQDTLGSPAPGPAGPSPAAAPGAGGGALASPVCLRVARMERWLAARAAADPDAHPSADLCLWVLEHLEAAGGR